MSELQLFSTLGRADQWQRYNDVWFLSQPIDIYVIQDVSEKVKQFESNMIGIKMVQRISTSLRIIGCLFAKNRKQ